MVGTVGLLTAFLCLVLGNSGEATCTNITNYEVALHRDLFMYYSEDVRPVSDTSASLNISMQLFLLAIDHINEKKQTITARVFTQVDWTDQFLKWKREDYGQVEKINVQTNNIWMPDLYLKNTVDKPTDIGQEDGRAVVSADGQVTMWPYKIITVGCKISVRIYPFDQQTCHFEFSSWTYPSSSIAMQFSGENVDLRYYQESGEWELSDTSIDRYLTAFGNDTWDHIVFEVILTRKWMYYGINMFAPIVFISVLNVLCFLLPPESGEKIALSISIFLTLTVFLTIVNSSLPESSDDVCILGVYIGLQLVGSGLTILFTVLSLFFFHKKREGPVPFFLCAITRKIMGSGIPVQDMNGQTKMLSLTEPLSEAPEVTYHHVPKQVSWQMVSSGLDRLFLWLCVTWHITLLLCVIIAVNA